jgi:hypothetical protein
MNNRSAYKSSAPMSAIADRAQAFAKTSLAKLETPPITPASPWGKAETRQTRTPNAVHTSRERLISRLFSPCNILWFSTPFIHPPVLADAESPMDAKMRNEKLETGSARAEAGFADDVDAKMMRRVVLKMDVRCVYFSFVYYRVREDVVAD